MVGHVPLSHLLGIPARVSAQQQLDPRLGRARLAGLLARGHQAQVARAEALGEDRVDDLQNWLAAAKIRPQHKALTAPLERRGEP